MSFLQYQILSVSLDYSLGMRLATTPGTERASLFCSSFLHQDPGSRLLASPAVYPASVSCGVEERLRQATQNIRVSESFKDYDPLRSGFITSTQFRRCLDGTGLRLSETEYEFLVGKYQNTKSKMVNYRAFAEALENAFNPNILDSKPSHQIKTFHSPAVSATPLPAETLQLTDQVLKRCQDYYKYHGISVKSCYCDFDRHHRGLVTESQFQRSFPGPPDVTPAEISTLAQRYLDPATGLYNYLHFHADIERLGGGGGAEGGGPPAPPCAPKQPVATLETIFEKIRDVVFKNGIRTTEFFRDHDKLRSGVITENQFICGLSLCCGQRGHLSREEIQRVVDYYRTPDGRVRYKEFCDLMENAYNVPELEKKPTATIHRPLKGHLSRPLNSLGSSHEEARLEEVLGRLRSEVKKRRLLLYPYFKDYDRGKGYTRGVTKPQFGRLLDFLSLQVTPEELKLIVWKFEDPIGGDVNYSAFIQAVDEEYTGQIVEVEEGGEGKEGGTLRDPASQSLKAPPRPVSVEELTARLQEHVYINRIRGSEHFQDFDPLRTGSISAARFRQGLSSLGQPYLTDAQISALCQHYADPRQQGCVCWKRFLEDIDQVFHAPQGSGPPSLPRLGAVDFPSAAGEEQQRVLEGVMFRLRERVGHRRVLAKPCFQDFDKHNMGYVTSSQFRQCLSYLGLGASEEEVRAMDLRFSDSKGFNYLSFLGELQPSQQLEDKYHTRMGQLTAKKHQQLASGGSSDAVETVSAEQVLDKIKTKVSKERIRVLEFMRDYDKLRSGRISRTSFRRALDLCGFGLNQAEVAALEGRFLSAKDPSCVDYMQFSDEVESIFTQKDLEKNPTAEVQQFVPPVEVDLNVLSPEEEQILQKTMHRLAEKVRVRRIQIFPLFEDYDRVHIGSVTRSQFHRVLSELGLGGLVNALEFGILYRKFDVKVGGRIDVNYIAFCEMVEHYAQTKWTDPSLK